MVTPKRVRPHPRLSSPKLGDYIEMVSAAERARLLRNQKFMPSYISATYRSAHVYIRRSLLRGGDINASLLGSQDAISALTERGARDATAKRCSIEAVHRFRSLYPTLGLAGARFESLNRTGYNLHIEGVRVSVFPIVSINMQVRGNEASGALLLVFRKERPLTKRSGQAIADIMRRAITSHALDGMASTALDPRLCLVVDVFHGGVFTPPSRSLALFRDVQSACREVSTLWPFIEDTRAA